MAMKRTLGTMRFVALGFCWRDEHKHNMDEAELAELERIAAVLSGAQPIAKPAPQTWVDSATNLGIRIAAFAGKAIGAAERFVELYRELPACHNPPAARTTGEDLGRGRAITIVGLDGDDRPDASAGPEKVFLNKANLERAMAVGQPTISLQGYIIQGADAEDEDEQEESEETEIDEAELAELQRLAAEFHDEQLARRAPLDYAATPRTSAEQAALEQCAAEFNKDRPLGIWQIAKDATASEAALEVLANDPTQYEKTEVFEIGNGVPPIVIQHDLLGVPGTGGTVWPAGAAVATWLAQHLRGDGGDDSARDSVAAAADGRVTDDDFEALRLPLPSFDLRHVRCAMELGSGTGLLAIALCKLGVPLVVATDGDPKACELARRNAEANDVMPTQMHVAELRWGEEGEASGELSHALACCDGRSGCHAPDLVVAADVWWMGGEEQVSALERTVRILVTAGARYVVFGYYHRLGTEHTFLNRLSDLGDVHPDVFRGGALGRCGITVLEVRPASKAEVRPCEASESVPGQ